ncbi:unnamed protein product [Ceratitis capitata]|uniref:(Mediterranean fruit fly) hypothetical protein n=1 Tax=Ceratitis capitata TaxID=7213 RepID=A0A811UF66_CERCA|nr:unnamed protein product [Ceratitis capitata]
MMRAPTLLVISSDEEEEVRSGEIDITEINSQRSGHGYTEYTRRVTMTMRIFNDRTTNTRPPQQQQVIENTTRYEEYNNVEEEQRGEPKTTPPGGRNFTNTKPLSIELIAKIQGRVEQQPGKRQTIRHQAKGVWYREV